MATPIKEYVCNLIAGRNAITGLYYAVDKARDAIDKNLMYCYKVEFRGIGSYIYNRQELFDLDNKAFCTPMNVLIQNVHNGVPTLDQYILIILKARLELENLYQARYKAMTMHEMSKPFCYRFTNPFGLAAGVNMNFTWFNNAVDFLTFFCICEGNIFDPMLVLGGL